MANTLERGVRRVGSLHDFDEETPALNVVLEWNDSAIGVTVSWSDPHTYYAGWFLGSPGTVDGPAVPAPTTVPRRMVFIDSHGSLLLIGCRARGYRHNVFGPGSGTVSADAAIIDVERDTAFERPHGLQTEISGLRDWLGMTSWKQDWDDRLNTVTWSMAPPPPIIVGVHRGLTLTVRPRGQVLHDPASPDRRVLLDLVHCITLSEQAVGWREHLQLHRAIRDLLVISCWESESCIPVRARRSDDPVRTWDGKEHGGQWREVVVPQQAEQDSSRRSHLIRFSELGGSGILEWLRLREEFGRALDPVITAIELLGTTENTLLAHTGPGLEALGYLLMLRDGLTAAAADRLSLETKLNRILQDVGDLLPFDGQEWARSTAAAYNRLKHAKRTAPDPVDIVNAWRESVLVARAWVAVELGVAPSDVQERLAADPERLPYIKDHDDS